MNNNKGHHNNQKYPELLEWMIQAELYDVVVAGKDIPKSKRRLYYRITICWNSGIYKASKNVQSRFCAITVQSKINVELLTILFLRVE